MSQTLPLYLYTFFNQLKVNFRNAEALLSALEHAVQQYGELHFKERNDECSELILQANQGQVAYLYRCGRLENLDRREALNLIQDMFQEIDWHDDEDWEDDEEEWDEGVAKELHPLLLKY